MGGSVKMLAPTFVCAVGLAMTNPTSLPPQVAELSAALSQPRPMRRGSVNERRMKCGQAHCACQRDPKARHGPYYTLTQATGDRKSTRLNSSHSQISYAVFCLKKKKKHRLTSMHSTETTLFRCT